jgi:drug/metabolite transporter (DMT)-like permease
MTHSSEKLKGEIFVFMGGLLWAIFPILIVLSYNKIPALISLGWSSLFSALAFSLLISYKKSWYQLKNKDFWKYILYISFWNGLLFYSLYYLGLEKTTPGNAALIGLLEVLTSIIFFNIIKKEKIPNEHKIGGLFMLAGAVIVLSRNFSHLDSGDFLIFLATCCGPIGNFYQQKAMKITSSEVLLFSRYLISAPFIFLLAFMLHPGGSLGFTASSLWLLLINGIIVLGLSKIFWVEAIHRLTVTKAISLSSINPLLTMLFSWLILKQTPTTVQLLAFIPLCIGVALLTDNIKLKTYSLIN